MTPVRMFSGRTSHSFLSLKLRGVSLVSRRVTGHEPLTAPLVDVLPESSDTLQCFVVEGLMETCHSSTSGNDSHSLQLGEKRRETGEQTHSAEVHVTDG